MPKLGSRVPPLPVHLILPLALLWMEHPERRGSGRLCRDERSMRENSQTRGDGREERQMAVADSRRRQKRKTDFKKTTTAAKNKQQGEKKQWKDREGSLEAPKVLKLIKMVCIYLWSLMSSFSIVCFPLIWIFPFHYVTQMETLILSNNHSLSFLLDGAAAERPSW